MKGYRTIIFNVVLALVFIANNIFGLGLDEQSVRGIAAPLTDPTATSIDWHALTNLTVAIVAPIGNIVLRKFTTTPIGKPV